MDAHDLYKSGQLDAAIEAMNEEVRSHPADPDRRSFLCDLLCIQGNYERADVQLEAIRTQLPGALPAVALIRQLVRSEQWRQQTFVEGRVPEFLETPTENLQLHLQATISLREGDVQSAIEHLARAEELRVRVGGTWDESIFDDFRDCDDVTSSFFEVLTSTGKYYWIPMEKVETITFHSPDRPRDLLWRRVSMDVRGGPDGEVFLPTIYAPRREDAKDAEHLGRLTEWSEELPVRGRGLRTYLVGDEAKTILEPGELHLSPVSG
ncbi:MAG: type VI secretion system accessory protein TagJ [Planctomycetota bacterium]